MKKENEKKIMIIKILVIILVIGIILLLWARYISTSGLVIKEIPIKTDLLDENYDGFKVIQFSDLHYGSTIGIKEVKNLVNKINEEKPNVVVFTGDLFEHDITISDDNLNNMFDELNKIETSIEILAVPGNHDYDQEEYWNKAMQKLNWKFLINSYEYVYSNSNKPIIFVGLDDMWHGKPNKEDAFSFINDNTKDNYIILLLHEPDYIDEVKDEKFNIALAGHSHLGQVRAPFIGAIYTPYGAKKYYNDHYKLDNDRELYISGGLGTSSLKVRFFDKPSITLYRFYTK